MQTRSLNAFGKTGAYIILVVALFGYGRVSQAEFDVGSRANWSLWRTGSSCQSACPGFERHTVATLLVGTLATATGNVTIKVIPFADLSDNVDGGNGYGYYDVYIGGTRMTSGVSGHVSGAPSDGKFRKTNGTRPFSCCFHQGNASTIVVTDAFFNSRLGAGGAAADQLEVEIQIPSGANVPCAAVANGCANMDDGTHRVEITWTSAPCNPPNCDDGNSCTNDSCSSGLCQHISNSNSCNDGIYCNGTDTCAAGSCSSHTGSPCALGQLCCENSDTCVDECCNNAGCSDGNSCTTDSCVSGFCQNTNNSNSCDDGIFCNGGDVCSNGSCSSHNGDPCPGEVCNETSNVCVPVIVGSDAPSGAIDARQPSDADGSNATGWDTVTLTMSSDASGLTANDFTITSTGGIVPIVQFVTTGGVLATLDFDTFIPPGEWTQITYDPSSSAVCLGYLPADVNNDGTSASPDILWLIDCLNGVQTCEIWQCDVDRSAICGAPDILMVIDLLNGAGTFTAWNNLSLPPNPCGGGGTGGGSGGGLSNGFDPGAGSQAAQANAAFADGFVAYLTETTIGMRNNEAEVTTIVRALTGWCVGHFTADERRALADRISNVGLGFADTGMKAFAPAVVAALRG